MMADEYTEREQILAKVRTGFDATSERNRRTRIAALVALGLGLLFGMTSRSTAATSTPATQALTSQGLASQGYSSSDIQRILAVQPWVEQYAAKFGVDPNLVDGVIWVESRFQPGLTSSAGARGMMQLMPGTQSWWEQQLGVPKGDPFDSRHNIHVGTYGLRRLLDEFGGAKRQALAAYNWGSGNVKGSPNDFPKEVEDYIVWVQNATAKFGRARSG